MSLPGVAVLIHLVAAVVCWGLVDSSDASPWLTKDFETWFWISVVVAVALTTMATAARRSWRTLMAVGVAVAAALASECAVFLVAAVVNSA